MKVYVDGESFLQGAKETAQELIIEGDIEKSRENVARWLARYAEMQDCDVLLVFSESVSKEVLPPIEEYGCVKVRNLTEKERIKREIASPANKRSRKERVYVVTDNPMIRSSTAGSEARVYGTEEFIQRARKVMGKEQNSRYDEPDEKYSGLSDEEVGFWMEYFNDKK